MNDHLRQTKMNTESTKGDLLRELANETRMVSRQYLLKAIWRLERQAVTNSPRRLERQETSGSGRIPVTFPGD